MDVIADIYRKTIQPSEKNMRKDTKYRRARNQVNQHYQTLSERLSQKDMAVLDKLMSCYEEKTERKNLHCFKNGFRIGHAIAVKSLE